MNNKDLRQKILDYATYTFSAHSTEHEDLDMLNMIFGTDITFEEVTNLRIELFKN